MRGLANTSCRTGFQFLDYGSWDAPEEFMVLQEQAGVAVCRIGNPFHDDSPRCVVPSKTIPPRPSFFRNGWLVISSFGVSDDLLPLIFGDCDIFSISTFGVCDALLDFGSFILYNSSLLFCLLRMHQKVGHHGFIFRKKSLF